MLASEMTDLAPSAHERRSEHERGKRERLIGGALQVVHEQGVEKTTIADVAHAADVPQGNVYYYFKTKDELIAAAIEAHATEIRQTLASFQRHHDPKARLKALVRMFVQRRDLVARYGCPQGTLCSELDKREDGLEHACAEMMRLPIDWAEEQFRSMGRRDARDLAVALIAAYQGTALLTNTFRDPNLMAREGRRLERWIDSLA